MYSKNKKGELARLKNLIGGDRINVTDDFDLLLKKDLKTLLSEYFDLDSDLKVSFEKEGNKFILTVSAGALRIKNFNSVPKS